MLAVEWQFHLQTFKSIFFFPAQGSWVLILQGLQHWCLKPGFSSDLQCYFDLNLLLPGDGLDGPSTANFCLQLPHFPDSVKHLLSSGSSGINITATARQSNTRAMSIQGRYPNRLITNQSMRVTKFNLDKLFLKGANTSSGWPKPWKTQQYGRHCQVQAVDAVPKDPSELLQILKWNSFMFRHWLVLPNISNAICIPQKRSQTLQVKPKHKPSQSLHLRKMFIFSSCRLRGAWQ